MANPPLPDQIPKVNLQELAQQVKSDDAEIRNKAEERIGYLSAREKEAIVPLLIKAFKDENESKRCWVALAFGKIPNAGIRPLIEAVNDKDPHVREGAVYGLSVCIDRIHEIGADNDHIKTGASKIIKALTDENAKVRIRAIYSYGMLCERNIPDLEKAIPILTQIVRKDSDRYARTHAASSLGSWKGAAVPAIPVLVQAVKETSPYDSAYFGLGKAAAQSLADIGTESLMPLLEVFSSPKCSLDARKQAAWGVQLLTEEILKQNLSNRVIPVLVRSTGDPEPAIRICALQGLREFGPAARKAIPDVVELIKKGDIEVRIWAASTLYSIDSKNQMTMPALLACLCYSQELVRIVSFGGFIPDGSMAALAILPTPILREKNEMATILVCKRLGDVGPDAEAAVPMLIDVLGDSRANFAARDALEAIGKAAVPALKKALENPNPVISEYAEFILGRIALNTAAQVNPPNPESRK